MFWKCFYPRFLSPPLQILGAWVRVDPIFRHSCPSWASKEPSVAPPLVPGRPDRPLTATSPTMGLFASKKKVDLITCTQGPSFRPMGSAISRVSGYSRFPSPRHPSPPLTFTSVWNPIRGGGSDSPVPPSCPPPPTSLPPPFPVKPSEGDRAPGVGHEWE